MKKKLTRFSFSGLSTFQSCPKAFEYKYYDELPQAFSSIEAHMGTSVHEILEWAYKERLVDKEPTLDEALDRYKHFFWNSPNLERARIIKTGVTSNDYYDLGKDYLASYFTRILLQDKSDTLLLEARFVVPLSEEFKFKGIIDRVARDENGVIRVIDYKTGKAGHPLDTLQLPSYAQYIFDNNMDNEIILCIEDLREKRTVTTTFKRRDVKQVRAQLLEQIEQVLTTRVFEAKPSVLCQWCGYNHICESAKEALKDSIQYVKHRTEKEVLEGCCPLCGGELRKRKGKFGEFMGCSNYPGCKYTYNLDSTGKHEANKVTKETEGKDICPECGSLLKERKGRFGPFIGCTDYPQCRFTREVDVESAAVEEKYSKK